jgi:hypothetical protein
MSRRRRRRSTCEGSAERPGGVTQRLDLPLACGIEEGERGRSAWACSAGVREPDFVPLQFERAELAQIVTLGGALRSAVAGQAASIATASAARLPRSRAGGAGAPRPLPLPPRRGRQPSENNQNRDSSRACCWVRHRQARGSRSARRSLAGSERTRPLACSSDCRAWGRIVSCFWRMGGIATPGASQPAHRAEQPTPAPPVSVATWYQGDAL